MLKHQNINNELIYLLIFISISFVTKPHIDYLFFDILANIFLLFLSLWYLEKDKIFTSYNLFVQIINGLWSSIIIFFTVLTIYYLFFHVHGKLVFSKTIFIAYIFFQALVAVTEELVFRECFYKIFSHIRINAVLIIILISFLFGVWHFYLHHSYTQFVSSFVFSFLIHISRFKIQNFTLISCIIAHFFYDILCYYLVFS